MMKATFILSLSAVVVAIPTASIITKPDDGLRPTGDQAEKPKVVCVGEFLELASHLFRKIEINISFRV